MFPSCQCAFDVLPIIKALLDHALIQSPQSPMGSTRARVGTRATTSDEFVLSISYTISFSSSSESSTDACPVHLARQDSVYTFAKYIVKVLFQCPIAKETIFIALKTDYRTHFSSCVELCHVYVFLIYTMDALKLNRHLAVVAFYPRTWE